jgi:hypothetical protein
MANLSASIKGRSAFHWHLHRDDPHRLPQGKGRVMVCDNDLK